MSGAVKMSERERKILGFLAERYDPGMYVFFRTIARATKLNIIQVRRSVRSLKRKGLVDASPVFDDDFRLAGSGHACTPAGKEALISP